MTDGRESNRSGAAASAGRDSTGGDLAALLSDVARSLQQEPDLQQTLQGIVDAAVGSIPGAQHVSVSSVVERRDVQTLAASDELPERVDGAQYETGEGPCLDTLYEQRTARIPDMAAEERWPAFAARAAEMGVGSMLSVQLFVRGGDLGALNLFSREIDAFDEESEHVSLLFASHAAVAMADAQKQEQLTTAVEFRDLVGQAKGILMERFDMSGDQAFRVLTRVSVHQDRTLRDTAAELVERRRLPDVSSGLHRGR